MPETTERVDTYFCRLPKGENWKFALIAGKGFLRLHTAENLQLKLSVDVVRD